MSISINKILNSHDIDELKVQSSFVKLKRAAKNQLSLKLNINSWLTLFQKANHLQKSPPVNKVAFNPYKRFKETKQKTFSIAKG